MSDTPELADNQVEFDGLIFEHLTEFDAFFKAHASIARGNGAVKVEMGVPREGRLSVFDLEDTVGQMLKFVVFRRVFTEEELVDQSYETEGDGG